MFRKSDATRSTPRHSRNWTSSCPLEGLRYQLYRSTNDVLITGWLLVPQSGEVKRGFIVGHGYGGCAGPDRHLPFPDAALLFPCARGISQSSHTNILLNSNNHVLHRIRTAEHYVLRGCSEDVWLGVSSLLQLFPQLSGQLGYLGISFSGGVGALHPAGPR